VLLLASYHPSFELHPAREAVEGGLTKPVYRGTAGYREWFEDWMDALGPGLRIEPLELVDLGDRLVLLAARRDARSRPGQRSPSHEQFASVVTLEKGRIVRDDTYSDHGEALAAAGL
jgi:ketosteroid isomerase-like protein